MAPHPLRNAIQASSQVDTTQIIRPTSSNKQIVNSVSSISNKRQKMSISQTYYLAHQARNKLAFEASRPAHNLRLLVGHANMLDSLMIELADAEQEQERWFNQTVSRANKASSSEEHPALKTARAPTKQHIQWADTIIEDAEEDTAMDSSSDSESDSDYDEDVDDEMTLAYAAPLRRAPTPPAKITITTHERALDSDEDDSSDFEDEDSEVGDLALVRIASHQPPELLHEDEDSDESDDDTMPPSPEQPVFELTKKQEAALSAKPSGASSSESQGSFFDEAYYLPQRSQGEMIQAY